MLGDNDTTALNWRFLERDVTPLSFISHSGRFRQSLGDAVGPSLRPGARSARQTPFQIRIQLSIHAGRVRRLVTAMMLPVWINGSSGESDYGALQPIGQVVLGTG